MCGDTELQRAAGWQGSQDMYLMRCSCAQIACNHGSAAPPSPLAGLSKQDADRDAHRACLACIREQDLGEQQLSWVGMHECAAYGAEGQLTLCCLRSMIVPCMA